MKSQICFRLKYIFSLLLIVSSNMSMAQEWEIVYDSIPSMGRQLILTNDSCFVATSANNQLEAGISLKIDYNGNILWVTPNGGLAIQQTYDNGYIIASGQTTQTAVLKKLDKNGNLKWIKQYGGIDQNQFHSVIQTTDTCFVACGYTQHYGDSTLYIIKTDSLGNLLWQRTFYNLGYGYVGKIIEKDENYFVVGHYYNNTWDNYLFISRLNKDGTTVWRKDYQTNGYTGVSMEIINDTSFIIIGGSIITKINSNGDTLWHKSFYQSCEFYAVDVTPNKDFILSGLNDYNIWYNENVIMKTDSNGIIKAYQTFNNGFSSSMNAFQSIKALSNNGYIACGYSNYNNTIKLRIIKADSLNNHSRIEELSMPNYCLTPFPNPTSGKFSIQIPKQFGPTKTLEVFDVRGQKQFEKTSDFKDLDISSLTSGLYFIVLTNNKNERQTIKIIKE